MSFSNEAAEYVKAMSNAWSILVTRMRPWTLGLDIESRQILIDRHLEHE